MALSGLLSSRLCTVRGVNYSDGSFIVFSSGRFSWVYVIRPELSSLITVPFLSVSCKVWHTHTYTMCVCVLALVCVYVCACMHECVTGIILTTGTWLAMLLDFYFHNLQCISFLDRSMTIVVKADVVRYMRYIFWPKVKILLFVFSSIFVDMFPYYVSHFLTYFAWVIWIPSYTRVEI
jgi:hypothetical protein